MSLLSPVLKSRLILLGFNFKPTLESPYREQYHSFWQLEHLFIASPWQFAQTGGSSSKLSNTSKLYVDANLKK